MGCGEEGGDFDAFGGGGVDEVWVGGCAGGVFELVFLFG